MLYCAGKAGTADASPHARASSAGGSALHAPADTASNSATASVPAAHLVLYLMAHFTRLMVHPKARVSATGTG